MTSSPDIPTRCCSDKTANTYKQSPASKSLSSLPTRPRVVWTSAGLQLGSGPAGKPLSVLRADLGQSDTLADLHKVVLPTDVEHFLSSDLMFEEATADRDRRAAADLSLHVVAALVSGQI